MPTTAPVVAPGGYLAGINSVNFSLKKHLDQYDRALLADRGPEGQSYRRAKTRNDPLLFAVYYLSHTLRTSQVGDIVSFSDAHLDMYRHALIWTSRRIPRLWRRHAWFMPRGSGKSSMMFKILLAWAAVHGHRKFVVAFSGSMRAAQKHLDYLRNTFATNRRLRRDFTIDGVCGLDPVKIAGRSLTVDIALLNGFRMTASGIESQELGTTTEEAARPDLILFDDCEKGEGTYSLMQAGKIKTTVLDTVLPMADDAIVEWVGTVTMGGGLADQMLQARVRGGGDERDHRWVIDEDFNVHLNEPLVVDEETGKLRSFWEARWKTVELLRLKAKGGRSWLKNFMNVAVGEDSLWFSPDDFRYVKRPGPNEDPLGDLIICSVDPAVVTDKKKARTAVTVSAFDSRTGRITCLWAHAGRWDTDQIRDVLIQAQASTHFSVLLWECNQGGTSLMWATLKNKGVIDPRIGVREKRVFALWQGSKTGFPESSFEAASKQARFERLQWDFQAEPPVLYFLSEDGTAETNSVVDLFNELIVYPEGMTVDLIDSFSTTVWWCRHRTIEVPSAMPQKGIPVGR